MAVPTKVGQKNHPQKQNCKVWANWFDSKSGTIKRTNVERTKRTTVERTKRTTMKRTNKIKAEFDSLKHEHLKTN